MARIAYKLVEGVNRVCTEAQEVSDSIILEVGQVFSTSHPAVQRVLDAHPGVTRDAAEVAPAAVDTKADPAPAADGTEAAS